MNFTLAELTRIKLEPGEVLTVKLYGDDYDPESVDGLKKQLMDIFPNNRIAMFVLPPGHDLQMEVLQAELNKLSGPVQETVQETVQVKDCSLPTSYCNDCGCGKKEMIESQNE